MGTWIIDDEIFGELTITAREGGVLASVSGEHLPEAVIRTVPGLRRNLLGARPVRLLSVEMTLADQSVPIRPGHGRFSRHSYRVEADHNGARYCLLADTESTSILWRDGQKMAELASYDDGGVYPGTWHGEVQPPEAAIGYVLASAYYTGAANPLRLWLEAAGYASALAGAQRAPTPRSNLSSHPIAVQAPPPPVLDDRSNRC